MGKSYEVIAASVWRGVVHVWIEDDLAFRTVFDIASFDTEDAQLPADWICSVFGGNEVQMVLGPPSIAGSLDVYQAFVEYPERVAR